MTPVQLLAELDRLEEENAELKMANHTLEELCQRLRMQLESALCRARV